MSRPTFQLPPCVAITICIQLLLTTYDKRVNRSAENRSDIRLLQKRANRGCGDHQGLLQSSMGRAYRSARLGVCQPDIRMKWRTSSRRGCEGEHECKTRSMEYWPAVAIAWVILGMASVTFAGGGKRYKTICSAPFPPFNISFDGSRFTGQFSGECKTNIDGPGLKSGLSQTLTTHPAAVPRPTARAAPNTIYCCAPMLRPSALTGRRSSRPLTAALNV